MTRLLRGYVEGEVRGAEPCAFLNRCAGLGLRFWDARPDGEHVLRVKLPLRDWDRAAAAAERCGCELTALRRRGLPLLVGRGGVRRRILLGAAALCTAVVLVSSLFVWEIEVMGNETVPEGVVRNVLEDCGVGIGAFWPAFRQDLIRSEALLELPELHWLTVNTFGSRATVIVRERVEAPETVDESAPTNLVAAATGIVERLEILEGRAMVEPGKAVTEGEVLAAAAMPGFRPALRLVHAQGEVYARTWRVSSAVAELEETSKSPSGQVQTRWFLLLGNNVISILQNSGQDRGECDIITQDSYLGIPGLFRLPVGLRRTTCVEWERQTEERAEEEATAALEQQLLEELTAALGADGEILSYHFTASRSGERVTVTLHAECREQIAREQPLTEEEIQILRAENTENTGEDAP